MSDDLGFCRLLYFAQLFFYRLLAVCWHVLAVWDNFEGGQKKYGKRDLKIIQEHDRKDGTFQRSCKKEHFEAQARQFVLTFLNIFCIFLEQKLNYLNNCLNNVLKICLNDPVNNVLTKIEKKLLARN